MLQAFDRILGLSEELSNDSLKRLKKQSRSREDYEHLADQRSHLTTNLPAPLEQEEQQLSDDVMLKVQNITTTITKAIGADLNTDAEIFTANKTAARMMIDVREKYANNPKHIDQRNQRGRAIPRLKIMLILSGGERKFVE
ncbi:MAG: hypothetical protein IPN94_17740 [Sphingobacteriales bacterium]|nr:hypothetical protein [Sphingobacteriales bacterium]